MEKYYLETIEMEYDRLKKTLITAICHYLEEKKRSIRT